MRIAPTPGKESVKTKKDFISSLKTWSSGQDSLLSCQLERNKNMENRIKDAQKMSLRA